MVNVGSSNASNDTEVDVEFFLGLETQDRSCDLNDGLACDQGRMGIDYSKHIIIARGSSQTVYRLCLLPDQLGAIYFDDQEFEGESVPYG